MYQSNVVSQAPDTNQGTRRPRKMGVAILTGVLACAVLAGIWKVGFSSRKDTDEPGSVAVVQAGGGSSRDDASVVAEKGAEGIGELAVSENDRSVDSFDADAAGAWIGPYAWDTPPQWAAGDYDETMDRPPTEAPYIPDGTRRVSFGGVSVAVPEDFRMEDMYYLLTYIPQDYPAAGETSYNPDSLNMLSMAYYEDAFDPGMEREYVRSMTNEFDSYWNVRGMRSESEDYHVYHFYAESSDGGRYQRISYYLFFKGLDVYVVQFINGGGKNQLEEAEKTLAFDPGVSFDAERDGSFVPWTGQEHGNGEEQPGGQQTGSSGSYEPTEEAVLSDFDWARNNTVKSGDWISSFDDITGTWKCLIDYSWDFDGLEYGNVTISGTASDAVLRFGIMKMQYNGEAPEDDEWLAVSPFTGIYHDGEIYLTGSGNISGNAFFVNGGKQYFIGNMLVPSGETYPFYLVRP